MVWTVHTTEDGKTYYYNTETQTSSWTNPEETETAAKKMNEFASDGNFMEQVRVRLQQVRAATNYNVVRQFLKKKKQQGEKEKSDGEATSCKKR